MIGFGIGKISEQKIWKGELSKAQKESDWWKSQLEMFYPPLPEEIYSLSGNVTDIEDNFLREIGKWGQLYFSLILRGSTS